MSAYGFAHLRSRRNHSDVIEYLGRIQATLDPFAGHFVIHGPPTEVVEGTWPGSMVLIEFPSLAEARAWYDSPAYRAILRLRTDHIEGDLLLIEGVGPNYDPAQRARTLRTEAYRAGHQSTTQSCSHPLGRRDPGHSSSFSAPPQGTRPAESP
ncbi:DUF1330 domain-containing protein [Streptomyces europaeiscabiei]|uniref:DUF1330 domain-containing protein n=1 Tax=Streptomyces europaeiscabiei TaxID=146819 RepID=UPI0029C0D93B|nr:DUF1330 domain-containing protein [Streptomyces europaeiscabiei]